MSGTTIQETKDLAYEVLVPGSSLGNRAPVTKDLAYEVLVPGQSIGAAAAMTKMVSYVVLTTAQTPEVWTGNFGTAGFANPAPSGFGAWNPPST